MFRLRRALVAATAALLLSLPAAAQPPREAGRQGCGATLWSGAGAVLERLLGGFWHRWIEGGGTLDPNGGGGG